MNDIGLIMNDITKLRKFQRFRLLSQLPVIAIFGIFKNLMSFGIGDSEGDEGGSAIAARRARIGRRAEDRA
jgi:hypothetical protein